MQMTASEVDNTLVVTVEERRVDAAVAVRFKERMLDLTGKPYDRVILDLAKVDFLDSSGLGAVVGSMKQLSNSCKLDLAGLTPTVDKVFRITRMDRVFRIYDSKEDALQDTANVT
jgi:anti-sigma B factor antagonist